MLRITIDNMNCGGCAKGVLATFRGLDPAVTTQVNLEAREVRIETEDAAPILAALRADGWKAHESTG